MLLLPEDTHAPLICVATGTGIAPYRSFWRRCFYEDVPNYKFTGLFWLFMGVANSDAKLYDNEIQEILATHPDQFRVDYALSREMQNKKGGKMYIQARAPASPPAPAPLSLAQRAGPSRLCGAGCACLTPRSCGTAPWLARMLCCSGSAVTAAAAL